MAIEAVKAYLAERGYLDRVMEFTVSSATVELAAQAVGVEGARIAKTLSFKDGDGCLLVVAAGDAKVDNTKFKAQFQMKAKMLSAGEVQALTGHAVGGVCPFAMDPSIPVYLDRSLARFETVFPAAGNASSAVRLTPEELYGASGARMWVDVCKGWQEDIHEQSGG